MQLHWTESLVNTTQCLWTSNVSVLQGRGQGRRPESGGVGGRTDLSGRRPPAAPGCQRSPHDAGGSAPDPLQYDVAVAFSTDLNSDVWESNPSFFFLFRWSRRDGTCWTEPPAARRPWTRRTGGSCNVLGIFRSVCFRKIFYLMVWTELNTVMFFKKKF